MPAVRHCSSRMRFAAPVGLIALLLCGCAGQAPRLTAAPAASEPAQAAAVPAAVMTKPSAAAGLDRPPAKDEAPAYAMPRRDPKDTAWCRYLDARAEAKRSLLLSPTVSASVDNDTKASAKVSYDLVDIARADLERKSAVASCARYHAADRISRMLFITPQSLTYAGNMEKARYLQSSRKELGTITRRIAEHVQNGEMTAQLAAGLTQYIETVRSLEFQAWADAYQRESVGMIQQDDTRGLDQQLTEAERALQEVDRRSRSLEALSVNLSAGINHDDRDDDRFFNDDSAYAKLTVSYRLGAMSPSRSRYEQMAEEARVEALRDQGYGTLWHTAELAKALGRVREGLLVQRERLAAAIAEARANSQKFSQGYEIELYQSRYRAQVDIIKLTADLRGIDGTLADIDKVQRNLRFK